MPRRSSKKYEIICPICSETICRCDDMRIVKIAIFSHVMGHIEKKEKDKKTAVREAWKFTNLIVDASEGLIIKDEKLMKEFEEYVEKYMEV